MDTLTAKAVYRNQLDKLVVFTDEEWNVFQQYLQLVTLKKRSYFAKAGEVGTQIGFILCGSVRSFIIKDGQEITNYFSLENDFISSYKSFITQQPGQTYIEALEDTRMMIFTKADLLQLMQNPVTAFKMERFGRLIAEYLICCYEDRVLSFITKTPEERYLQLLEDNKSFVQRIPQHYLANFLGITPVSLSRIRKRILEPIK